MQESHAYFTTLNSVSGCFTNAKEFIKCFRCENHPTNCSFVSLSPNFHEYRQPLVTNMLAVYIHES